LRERNVSRRTGIGESCKSGRHRADRVMATEMAGIVGSCLAIGVWHWLFVGRNIRSVCLYGDGRLLLVGMAQDWHKRCCQTLQRQDQQQHRKHDMFESIVHMSQVYKKTLENRN